MERPKLTKAEIVDAICDPSDTLKKDVQEVLGHLIDAIKGALEDERVVELRGFGTFEVRGRKGRDEARNPKTGELVTVKDHQAVVFRPGKELKAGTWKLRE